MMFKTILASLLMIAFGYAISTGVHDWRDNATSKQILGAVAIAACDQYTGTVIIHRDGTQVGLPASQVPLEKLEPLFDSLAGAPDHKDSRIGTVNIPCLQAQDPTQAMPGDLPDDKSV